MNVRQVEIVHAMKQIRNISGLVKYMNKPDVAKQAAAKAGLRKFQGSDCKYGHGGIRYTKTGQCVDCIPMYRELNKKKLSNAITLSGDVQRKDCRLVLLHQSTGGE